MAILASPAGSKVRPTRGAMLFRSFGAALKFCPLSGPTIWLTQNCSAGKLAGMSWPFRSPRQNWKSYRTPRFSVDLECRHRFREVVRRFERVGAAEVEGIAVYRVSARLRHDVDRARRRPSELGRVGARHHLEFLNGLRCKRNARRG